MLSVNFSAGISKNELGGRCPRADGEEQSLEEIRGGWNKVPTGAVEGQHRGTVSDQHAPFII